MAFNPGTGGAESEEEAQDGRMSEAFTPDNLFCCEFAPTSMRQSSCGIQNIRTPPGSELSKPQGPPADGKPDGTLCALEANPTPQAEQHK